MPKKTVKAEDQKVTKSIKQESNKKSSKKATKKQSVKQQSSKKTTKKSQLTGAKKAEAELLDSDTKLVIGRPKIELNWEDVDKLLALHCTLAEVAAWFFTTEDTIEKRVKEEKGMLFSEYATQKRAIGKASLRRRQFQKAIEGNVTMLIWLGKQWLGQTDKAEMGLSGDLDINVNIEVPDLSTKEHDLVDEIKKDK